MIKTQDVWVVKEGADLNDPITILKPMTALEKKSGMMVMTLDEFKQAIANAFDAGESYYKECVEYWEHGTPITKPDKTEYLNNLFNK